MRSQHFWAWQKALSASQNLTIHHTACPSTDNESYLSFSSFVFHKYSSKQTPL